MKANLGGIRYPVSPDLFLSIAKGEIVGHRAIVKFGENSDIDTGSAPEDIWEFGGIYQFSDPGVADIVSLSSDNAADTETILVNGLDINGIEVNQLITLQGQTRVALTTPLWRVQTMQNDGMDGGDLVGTVYCYAGTEETDGVPDGASVVKSIITPGMGRTLQAIYTIPLGKVGFAYLGEVGLSRSQSAGSAEILTFARGYNRVFKVFKHVNISASGSSIYQEATLIPSPAPALTDIKFTVDSVSANGTGVFGAFTILLVDDNQLSKEYLAAINQPTTTTL